MCAESRGFHTTIVLISCHYSPQALRQEKPHITEHTRRFWATPLTSFFITRVRKILTPRVELELIKNLIRSHKEKPPPPARLTRFAARTESVEMEKSSFDTHTCARMILYLAPGPNWCEMIRRYRSNAINSPSAYRTRRIAAAKTNAKTLKAVLYLYIYIALRIHHA